MNNESFYIKRCECIDCRGKYLPENENPVPISNKPTPWAVHCNKDGLVFLTHHEYTNQMNKASSLWKCPICNDIAFWSDDNYELYIDSYEEWIYKLGEQNPNMSMDELNTIIDATDYIPIIEK